MNRSVWGFAIAAVAHALAFAAVAVAAAPAARADEIDDAAAMFTADDGLTAAEKLPALRALVEAHKDNPKVEKLRSVLKVVAAEAGEKVEAATSAALPTGTTGVPPVDGGASGTPRPTTGTTGVPPVAEAPATDPLLKALHDRFSQPPPTDEECQAAFAKLPPLKPLPVPPLAPIKTPIPDAFINSAGRRAAIMNVKETLRVMIGDMEEADQKVFDEKWTAALDYPCAEVTEWLKKASPILTELVKRKAEAEEASDEYEEALTEANLYRLNRFWIPAYEAMREMLTVAERVKMLQARMEELVAALEALGEMPDPNEIKKKRLAERKAAEQTVRECFGVQTKIGGWYEAVGMHLSGKPAILDAKGKVVAEPAGWKFTEPEKMLYIRPLFKCPGTGLTVVYVNSYDDAPLPEVNTANMLDDAGGGLSSFSSEVRTTYTPFLDEDGNECLSVKSLWADLSASSTLYRRVEGVEGDNLYGHTKDKVLGSARQFDRYNPEAAKDNYDKVGAETWCKLRSDELKEAVEDYQEALNESLGKKKSAADMPFAKDVYYVLTGMEPAEYADFEKPVTNGLNRTFCSMYSEENCSERYRELRNKIEPPPMVNEFGGTKLVPDRSYHFPEIQEHSENIAQNAMFRCDVKRIEEKYFIANRSGKKMQLDSGTAETHARWMPPTTVVRAAGGKFKMPFWPEAAVGSPMKHIKMTQGLRVRCFTKFTIGADGKYCDRTFAEGKHGKFEIEGWLTRVSTNMEHVVSAEAPAEATVELFVSPLAGGKDLNIMGTMGIRYKYKRMILTEEEAERIAKEITANCTEAMRNEWDAQEFASVASQIDEYVAKLKTKEEDAVALGERIALHEENKRWLMENVKRREEQMKKELETIRKHQEVLQKDADEVNRTREEIVRAGQKIEKERDEWWHELLTTGKTWNQDAAYNEAVQRRQTLEGHYSASYGKFTKDRFAAEDEISEASKRYAQLEFARLCDISNFEYENAMVEAEKTGEFHPPYTAFDDICHKQLLESCQRDVERDREAKNVRANVRRAIQRLSEQEDAKMRGDLERLAKYGDEDQALSTYEKAVKLYGTLPPANEDSIDEWRAFGRTISKINAGHAGQQAAQAELNLIDAEQRLHNAKCVKGGCTALLCIGSMGATTPAAAATMHNLMMAHFMVDGFAEKGVYGAAEGFVRCYSGVADFIISGIEGYRSDGWRGVALHIGGSVAFHVGMPFIAKTGILTKDVKTIYRDAKEGLKKGAKDGYAKLKSLFKPKAAVKAAKGRKTPEEIDYDKFRKEGEKVLSEYISKVQTLSRLDERTMTNEQIEEAKKAVVKAAAAVNQHPEAKLILKNDAAYENVAKRFTKDIEEVYTKMTGIFHRKMREDGFSIHAIKQFRNEKSLGTVGMDADYGMVTEKFPVYKANGKVVYEPVPITQNGKRINLATWRDKGEPKLHEAYKEATFGVGDGEKAWVNLTTSKSAEAYRCGDVLSKTSTEEGVRAILDKMSLSDMQQTVDVTIFKAQDMLNKTEFPRLARLVETCRGTAKDLYTKFLPMIDVRIKDIRALKVKMGSKFTPAQEKLLTNLENARTYYGKMADAYTKIGNHTIEPPHIDAAVKAVTTNQGVLESLDRLSVLMQSLVLPRK